MWNVIEERDAERSAWPYPSLIPHSIKAYPIVQIAKEARPRQRESSPFKMRHGVAAWKDATPSPTEAANLIYIHVPFCPFLCSFCPLYKSKRTGRRADDAKRVYVPKLIEEIRMYARLPAAANARYSAVYLGGGTPTELLPDELGRILGALKDSFHIEPDAEITLEGVARQLLAPEYLERCILHGFNRVSWGIQSLDPAVRRAIGRGDAVDDYRRLIRHARTTDARVTLNTDLMAGLPHQGLGSLLDDVQSLVRWGMDSVDVYYYVIMPGTKLHSLVNRGDRDPPQYGEGLLQMRKEVNDTLRAAGYTQLTGEVFARRDCDLFTRLSFGESGNRLNTILAFGPSAFGFVNGTIYHNVPDLQQYNDLIGRGLLPFRAVRRINCREAQRRAMLLGILSLSICKDVIPLSALSHLSRWSRLGLVEEDGREVRLTSEGALWYNMMQLELLSPLDLLQSLQLFGSLEEQRRMSASTNTPEHYRALQAVVFGEGRLSRVRRALYKAYLFASRWMPIDGRAIGFTSNRHS